MHIVEKLDIVLKNVYCTQNITQSQTSIVLVEIPTMYVSSIMVATSIAEDPTTLVVEDVFGNGEPMHVLVEISSTTKKPIHFLA